MVVLTVRSNSALRGVVLGLNGSTPSLGLARAFAVSVIAITKE